MEEDPDAAADDSWHHFPLTTDPEAVSTSTSAMRLSTPLALPHAEDTRFLFARCLLYLMEEGGRRVITLDALTHAICMHSEPDCTIWMVPFGFFRTEDQTPDADQRIKSSIGASCLEMTIDIAKLRQENKKDRAAAAANSHAAKPTSIKVTPKEHSIAKQDIRQVRELSPEEKEAVDKVVDHMSSEKIWSSVCMMTRHGPPELTNKYEKTRDLVAARIKWISEGGLSDDHSEQMDFLLDCYRSWATELALDPKYKGLARQAERYKSAVAGLDYLCSVLYDYACDRSATLLDNDGVIAEHLAKIPPELDAFLPGGLLQRFERGPKPPEKTPAAKPKRGSTSTDGTKAQKDNKRPAPSSAAEFVSVSAKCDEYRQRLVEMKKKDSARKGELDKLKSCFALLCGYAEELDEKLKSIQEYSDEYLDGREHKLIRGALAGMCKRKNPPFDLQSRRPAPINGYEVASPSVGTSSQGSMVSPQQPAPPPAKPDVGKGKKRAR